MAKSEIEYCAGSTEGERKRARYSDKADPRYAGVRFVMRPWLASRPTDWPRPTAKRHLRGGQEQ